MTALAAGVEGIMDTRGATMAKNQHHELLRELLAEPNPLVRARRATAEIERLDAERTDLTAVRDVAIHRLANKDDHSYNMIADGTGLSKSRVATLVYRANKEYAAAARHLARLRRQFGD